MLPIRKATLAPAELPPPLPGNKPVIPASPDRRGNSAESPPVPPPLPTRSRAQTVSRADAPPLPVRMNTPSLGSTPSVPPIPTNVISLPASPQPTPEGSPVDDGRYQPRPPPMRSAIANTASPPRRQETKVAADLSSEDEDEPALLTGLSATAKRAMEDYPDSTHANRRPPKFVPDVRIVVPHHIYAFAVFGRHVCTGAHHVRVYDTQMSDRPIFIVDLRDTGLEFRIKEPKVTAMCFRAAAHPKDEGRHLWCGTKDGHLWELDIMTGNVTDTKAFAHAASVSYIFRHQQYMITLDEGGKMHVFEVAPADKEDSGNVPVLVRTLRVSDKFNFARMICGKLWTATAPINRSTTNAAASKGATVRVYEPCATGTMPPGTTMLTTEWTGAVTSATIMPLRPDVVYLGHEGGFISIWSSSEMVCKQVVKISASDILALEGVGERLWAGNRKGQIHVYDVSQKPWQATNVWTAHP